MKQRTADYIADFLVAHGISDIFTVPGGNAMFLNDAFGHHPGLHCVYNHHEQASAMAAEAYARIDNRIAAVCVTSGPGATNAITGVVCGWMESIPMLILSGQSRYATTVYASGLKLRTRGIQEFDVTGSVRNMTKYCVLVTDANDIRYCLEKALFLAKNGRPGPVWLDIPLDVQGKMIETEQLKTFDAGREGYSCTFPVSEELAEQTVEKLRHAVRPVIFAGNGIRLAGAHEEFMKFVNLSGIPVVDGMSSVDAIPTGHPLFAGRGGTTGTRAGNFAIQNCDVLLSLGSRLNYNQTGFNSASWARAAYKMINDIDPEEIQKDSIHADLALAGDVKDLLIRLNRILLRTGSGEYSEWVQQCRQWKERYPVVTEEQRRNEKANPYCFFDLLTRKLPAEVNLVVSVGQSRVIGSQSAHIKDGQRFLTNASTASMGYGLPAAIGACIANRCRKTVLVTGEGSIQMNLQELQTIVQNRLPVIVIVANNGGYHTVKQTQKNYFHANYTGIGLESGDLSFPDMSKIADAYGLPYASVDSNAGLESFLDHVLSCEKPMLTEVFLDPEQTTVPKAASKRLENGEMVSTPLEDMAPFLPEEEIKMNMYIPVISNGGGKD